MITPRAMLNKGSTVEMAGRLAASGPAWKMSWLSSRPPAPATITAYSCQLVTNANRPCSAIPVRAFNKAAVAA